MGKVGRIVCIFTPMALTVAALVCLVLVFVGQQNKGSSVQNSLYFFRADTSKFRTDPNSNDNKNIDTALLAALQQSNSNKTLKDFYQVGLFNYCEGDKHGSSYDVTHCSAHQTAFWFNPVDVWGLQNSTVEKLFPGTLRHGLDAYHKVAGWMFVAYLVALVGHIVEILVGALAVFSRWGSLATTVVSGVATVFYTAAAITSTVLYGVLTGAFDSGFHNRIHASMGTHMLATVWLGVVFSMAAGFFWTISVCCCSGHSDSPHGRHKKRGTTAEKAGYTYQGRSGGGGGAYERVPSPNLGAGAHQHGTPMHDFPHSGRETAYEPFRSHAGA